ncbi:kinase-like domain-containing protein [Powellomyces hirtus]|nr:kinase-like domain-containing protein [Powellomyces hirtus]
MRQSDTNGWNFNGSKSPAGTARFQWSAAEHAEQADTTPCSPTSPTCSDFQTPEKPHKSLPSDLPGRKTGLANSRSRSVDFNLNKKSQASSVKQYGDRRKYMAAHQVVETSTIYAMHEPAHAFVSHLGDLEESQGKVNQYHIIKDIGSGAYGRVVLCRNEQDRRYYACKIVSKARLRKKFRWSHAGGRSGSNDSPDVDHLATIKREVAILKKLSKHPNINALVEVLDDGKEDNLYMIFELCEYGPVMKLQVRESVNPLSEDLARQYFRDVVLGLEYLHYKRIIHRDLKPENLLLKAGPPLGVVQIADFGISNMFEDGEEEPIVDDKNSSPLFSPPEACQSHTKQLRGFAVDIWALGVSLYCLVHGRAPWQEESIILLYEKIVGTPAEPCETLSAELRDLLSRMLKKDPDERIALQDVKQHPWITNNGAEPMLATEENCVFEDVTEEEVENAFQPAMMFVTKVSYR